MGAVERAHRAELVPARRELRRTERADKCSYAHCHTPAVVLGSLAAHSQGIVLCDVIWRGMDHPKQVTWYWAVKGFIQSR